MKNRVLILVLLAALLVGGMSLPREAQAGGASGGTYCHVVKRGETLTSIANQYGVSVQALAAANNLANPNVIYVGQCLVIPGTTPPTSCGPCTVTHTVKSGEYLKQIAAKYGSTWQCIASANGLSNPNLIYPGQRLVVPVKCPGPKPPPPKPTPPPTGTWTAQYWTNPYLSGNPTWTNYPTKINNNWGTGGPGDSIPGTNFSARYTQNYQFGAGTYRFKLLVDDGVRFWVDDVLLIDQWHDSAPVEYVVDKQLSAGVHRLQIDYYQHLGAAQLRYTLETLNGTLPWTCEYFNNTNLGGTPVTTQHYSSLDFAWGNTAPAAGVTADYFSARCTGQFGFAGGRYQFKATVDDGVRVWVDSNLIIDQWHLSPPATYTVDVDVPAGNHTLKVEYFENNGSATLKLLWTQR
jgi:LysM repeat protein